ncbi:MAG: cytidylate kinase-like family protein [Deltaproteobacteria bacterium]|nr:cytidylate kinase-like family protein [Deltaproteobacteria bacterium]
MPVITISNQFGAGGPEVGREVAKRLGLDYFDKEIIHRVGLEINVPNADVQEFEDEHHSKYRSFFSTIFDLDALKRKAKVREESLADAQYDDRDKIPYQFHVDGWIDSEIYKQMIEKVVSALGQRRGVVIVGRGGQCILKENPRTVHVRFVAEFEDRVAWAVKRRELAAPQARDLVRELDVRKQDYLRFYFDADPDLPTSYHVVLNTSRVSLTQCADIVERLAADVAEGATA